MKIISIIFGICLLTGITMSNATDDGLIPTELMTLTASNNNSSVSLAVTELVPSGLMNTTRSATVNHKTNKTTYKMVCIAEKQPEMDNFRAFKEEYLARAYNQSIGAKEAMDALDLVIIKNSTRIGPYKIEWVTNIFNGTVTNEMVTISFIKKSVDKEYSVNEPLKRFAYNLNL